MNNRNCVTLSFNFATEFVDLFSALVHAFRKYLIENIRVSLFCPNQSHLLYAQSCYEFHMECNRVTPSNIANVGQDSKPFEHLSFGDDWTSRKVTKFNSVYPRQIFERILYLFRAPHAPQGAVLYPETAAIIVLRTNVTHFSETNEFLLDAFILYNIVDETGKSIELQLHAGRIQFDTDVLHDRNYAIQFDKDHGECSFINLFVLSYRKTRRIQSNGWLADNVQSNNNIVYKLLRLITQLRMYIRHGSGSSNCYFHPFHDGAYTFIPSLIETATHFMHASLCLIHFQSYRIFWLS